MLEKITFQNGVVVKSDFLNEIQKTAIINPETSRRDFYSFADDVDNLAWHIAERDSIKDWEISDPTIEPETNLGRLAHDGILLGCVNCGGTDVEPISFQRTPTITRKYLDDSLIENNQIGVIVKGGTILDESLSLVTFDTSVVIIEPSAINYIYVIYNSEPIVVSNSSLPSRATRYTPLLKIELDDQNEIIDYLDLRPGVYIDSLVNRFSFLQSTELIETNYTLKSWERAVVNTSNGEVFITTPENPVNNDIIAISDAFGTFDSFNVTLVPSPNHKINNSIEPVVLNKANTQTSLFFFEPLNTWLFADDYISQTYKDLGEFISCGGWECIGITDAIDCPHNTSIPPQFPNASEGTYHYDATTSKCFKKLNTDIAVHSDGKGNFIKLHNSSRCLNKVQPSLKDNTVIKVDLRNGNDHINNNGLDKPFKTLQRALLESTKRPFDKISIQLEPETYLLDNSRGSESSSIGVVDSSGLFFRSSTGHRIRFVGDNYIVAISESSTSSDSIPRGLELGRVVYSDSGANAVISKIRKKLLCSNDECGWILEIKYKTGEFIQDELLYYDNFSVLNPTTGGVIVPNGVSIISTDLRKTKISPVYVPTEGESSIFKLTGNTYISDLTFIDNPTHTKSHSRLTAIEFVSQSELEYYYKEKLKTLFGEYLQDVNEISIVAPQEVSYISRLVDEYENLSGQPDLRSEDLPINGDSAEYSGYIYYPGKIKFEGYIIPDINNTRGASPYIKNCSIRSNFGLSGVLIDGNKVLGNKSMLISETSIVSLQLDPNCFENAEATYYGSPKIQKNYKKDSQYRSFGIKAINSGYAQVVSCYIIASSDHFVCESGAELSISNSCSNFGELALVAKGYKVEPYFQDYSRNVDLDLGYFGTEITKIIPPKPLALETLKVNTNFYIDLYATYNYYINNPSTKYRLYIRGDSPNSVPSTLDKYSYTQVDAETHQVSLSTGDRDYRSFLCIDAIDFLGGRATKTTYFTKIDATGLSEYNPDLDESIQIFKYDPEPLVESTPAVGTYTINTEQSIIVREDAQSIPISFSEGRFFYINQDKSRIYTVSKVNLSQETVSYFPEIVGDNLFNCTITFVPTDYLGGLWYVDVEDVDFNGDYLKLSTALLDDFLSPIAHLSGIYTLRDRDLRQDSDRIYKIVIKGFNKDLGVRDPQERYILESSRDYNLSLNASLESPLAITNLKKINEGEFEVCLVQSDNSRASKTRELYPQLNYDNPELSENPPTSITYQAVKALAEYPLSSLEAEDLVPSNSFVPIRFKDSFAPFNIELRKPSTIRATSHVWEYVGLLNYDSALLEVQSSNFSDFFENLMTERNGGKIYATGSTESGNFIIGSQIINLDATDGISNPLNSSPGPLTGSLTFPRNFIFDQLGINSSLRLAPFSKTSFETRSTIQFSSKTALLNELNTILTSSDLDHQVYASDDRAGFIQIATQSDVDQGVSDILAVSPKTLKHAINSIPLASEETAGLIKLSSSSLALEGTNDDTAITPLKLHQVLDTLPLDQATEETMGILKISTTDEAIEGINDEKAITPLKLKEQLDSYAPIIAEAPPSLRPNGSPLKLGDFWLNSTNNVLSIYGFGPLQLPIWREVNRPPKILNFIQDTLVFEHPGNRYRVIKLPATSSNSEKIIYDEIVVNLPDIANSQPMVTGESFKFRLFTNLSSTAGLDELGNYNTSIPAWDENASGFYSKVTFTKDGGTNFNSRNIAISGDLNDPRVYYRGDSLPKLQIPTGECAYLYFAPAPGKLVTDIFRIRVEIAYHTINPIESLL